MSLKIIQEEKLNNPILILSFYGWSDAGYAASSAIRYLIKDSNAHKIAKIDSENFMNFSQTRPKVLMKNNKRQIQWPDSSFYAIKRPNHKNDLLVFLGHEPNFMWNDFFNVAYEFCQKQEINNKRNLIWKILPITCEPLEKITLFEKTIKTAIILTILQQLNQIFPSIPVLFNHFKNAFAFIREQLPNEVSQIRQNHLKSKKR